MRPAPAPRTDGAPLGEAEFRQLRDLLYDKAGLFFGPGKKSLLESRVARRVRAAGAGSVREYLELLRSPVRGSKELLELLDVVTTHETSFFRNQPQLDAFRRKVLPALVSGARDRGARRLRLWSAACSSGEEPYTLAMIVLEVLGDEAPRWDVQILGTDIAQSVLAKAEQAEYGRYSFRGTPAYYIQKYFEAAGPDTFRVKEAPRRLVRFRMLNFADDLRMRQVRGLQVVFCRNALIYFDKPAKRRFVAHFHQALEPGGYLFVGHSESLHGISDEFKLIHFPGALAYQKPPS